MSNNMETTYQYELEKNEIFLASGTSTIEISRSESVGIIGFGNHLLTGFAEKQVDPLQYAETVRSYRNDAITEEYLRQTGYFRENNGEIPFYVDIPVTGEIAFMCDRRIWQSEIFCLFIYFQNKGAELQFSKLWKWLTQHQKIIRIDQRLSRTSGFIVQDKLYSGTMAKHALLQYLHYLSYLGFICSEGYLKYNQGYPIKTRTFSAPGKANESRFRRLLADGSLQNGNHG
ncbi:MAG: hypothetical protein ACYCYM_13180, partial [Saccharofermentanales bacterium]